MSSKVNEQQRRVLLTGANGVVGQPLLETMIDSNFDVLRVSRKVEAGEEQSLEWDLQQPLSTLQTERISRCDTLIHCAPIWLLPEHLAQLSELGIKRLVVFSSTSVISKKHSVDPSEQNLVNQLSAAEEAIKARCEHTNVAYTILRPSMIYGYGRDQNVSKIAAMISRYKFMVLAGKAKGLRQPVHADDLVKVVLDNLGNTKSYAQTYSLAGGEALSYRSMVERIFTGMGLTPRIVSVPESLMRTILWLAAKVTRFDYTSSMATRMSQDLVYDCEAARQELGFDPQSFLVNPQRDLPRLS